MMDYPLSRYPFSVTLFIKGKVEWTSFNVCEKQAMFFCFRQHRTLVTIVVILFMVQLFVFAVFYAAWNPPPARREPAEPKEPTTLKTQKSEPLEAPKAAPLSAGMLSKLWKKPLETYIDLKRNMIVC